MPRKNARPDARKQREKLNRKMAMPKGSRPQRPRYIGAIAHHSPGGIGWAALAAMILTRHQRDTP